MWWRTYIDVIIFLVGLIVCFFFPGEWTITVIILLATLATLYFQYQKGELLLFGVGILLGAALEIGGDLVYQLQYWSEGSILGKPAWLFVLWGYLFVLIRRVGNKIVNGSKN